MKIRNIAKLAGVSTATVSHVINSTRFVSDEVKRKVQEVIESNGYTPNAHAQQWKPAPVTLKTQWGERVTPDNAWREYSRPQLVQHRVRPRNADVQAADRLVSDAGWQRVRL